MRANCPVRTDETAVNRETRARQSPLCSGRGLWVRGVGEYRRGGAARRGAGWRRRVRRRSAPPAPRASVRRRSGPRRRRRATRGGDAGAAAARRAACPDVPDATCSTLRVPLDRSRRGAGTLDLRVAVAGDARRAGRGRAQRRPRRARAAVPQAGARVARAGRRRSVRLVGDRPARHRRATRCAAPRCRTRWAPRTSRRRRPRRCGRARRRSATQRRFFTTADTVEDLEALRHRAAGAASSRSTASPTARSSRSATRSPTRERVSGARARLGRAVRGRQPALGGLDQGDAAGARRGDDRATGQGHHASTTTARRCSTCSPALSVGAPRGNGAANAIARGREGNTGPLDGLHEGVRGVMRSWTAERAQPGPAREHAVRGLARAVGRRRRAARGPRAGARRRRREALRRRPLPVRPRDRDRQRARPAVPELAAGRAPARAARPRELPDVPTLLLAGDQRPLDADGVGAGQRPSAPRAAS